MLLSVSIKANALRVELRVTFFIHHTCTTSFTHIRALPLEAYSEHHISLSLKNKHAIGT